MMDEEDDDVLELTQAMPEPEPEEDHWDMDVPDFSEPAAEPLPDFGEPDPEPPPPPPRRPSFDFDDVTEMPPPRPRPRSIMDDFDNGLISRRTADDASQHLTNLARKLGDDLSIGPMPVGIRTVEDVVRELLKPLLKEWLDENLPTIVERLVQQEIDRMIRRTQRF